MNIVKFVETLGYFFDNYGYITIFAASFLEMTPLGWIVPGGATLAIAGFFANGKDVSYLVWTILFGTFGSWIAFMFSYALGKKTGMWLVKRLKQQKNAQFAKRMLANNGPIILTTSMMANMTRFWISYIAGVDSYSFPRFLSYSLVASFGWTCILVLGGYFAGYERDNLQKIMGSIGILGWILLAAAIFVLQKSIRHEYRHFKEDNPYDEDFKNK